MQEQDRRSGPPERPGLDDHLVRRLDALSRDEAERVLERAIRIQSQKHASDRFTQEQVRRIAAELGVDGSIVDRALREEVTTAAPLRDSWLVADALVDKKVVTGSETAVESRVMAWMEREEGLSPVAPITGGLRWQPDRHWTTVTRLAMGSDATKALRGMAEVVHRQTSLGPEEQLVELEVETGRIRATAWGVGGGVTAVGVAAGAVIAGIGGGNDLLEFATGAAPGLLLGVGSLILIARAWAASIRSGMARALDGIAHAELYRRSSRRRQRREARADTRRPRSTFSRLVDDVTDALDDLFD